MNYNPNRKPRDESEQDGPNNSIVPQHILDCFCSVLAPHNGKIRSYKIGRRNLFSLREVIATVKNVEAMND